MEKYSDLESHFNPVINTPPVHQFLCKVSTTLNCLTRTFKQFNNSESSYQKNSVVN